MTVIELISIFGQWAALKTALDTTYQEWLTIYKERGNTVEEKKQLDAILVVEQQLSEAKYDLIRGLAKKKMYHCGELGCGKDLEVFYDAFDQAKRLLNKQSETWDLFFNEYNDLYNRFRDAEYYREISNGGRM